MTIPQSYQKSNAASTKTRNILDSVTVYNLLFPISFIKTDKEDISNLIVKLLNPLNPYFWQKSYIQGSALQRASFRLHNLGMVIRLLYSTEAIPASKFFKELAFKLNIVNINALFDYEGGRS
jgi:hypothetical protein